MMPLWPNVEQWNVAGSKGRYKFMLLYFTFYLFVMPSAGVSLWAIAPKEICSKEGVGAYGLN